MWHQKVLADTQLTCGAKCFAGAVMHKYRVARGYASLSYREAAKMTGMSTASAKDARDQLIEAGWLVRLGASCGKLEKARYALRVRNCPTMGQKLPHTLQEETGEKEVTIEGSDEERWWNGRYDYDEVA